MNAERFIENQRNWRKLIGVEWKPTECIERASPSTLSQLFSLGVEDIDLVATKVPGDSARERMHIVMLLQSVASYLSGGVARIDGGRLRDAMRHYDADVGNNFNRDLRAWAAERSGSRTGGDLTLTTRRFNAAKDLIKDMTDAEA